MIYFWNWEVVEPCGCLMKLPEVFARELAEEPPEHFHPLFENNVAIRYETYEKDKSLIGRSVLQCIKCFVEWEHVKGVGWYPKRERFVNQPVISATKSSIITALRRSLWG
jgi:hypothetical protein